MAISRTQSLHQLVDRMPTFAALLSRDGVVLEINRSGLDLGGMRPEQVYGKHFSEIGALAPSVEDGRKLASMMVRAARGETIRGVLNVRAKGSRMAIVDATFVPLHDDAGRVVEIGATGVEVTSHLQAEAALAALNRQLRVLTWCRQVLIRADDEQGLLQRICEVIVGQGGYRFAWIGFAERDATRTVRPVAASGIDPGYLEQLEVNWADTAAGRGPTGRAIREHRVAICRDILTDPAFAPWRTQARSYGYAASIALPLMLDGECAGALNIYSALPSAFDAAEVELLTELANDLAFGLKALRTRDRHFHAEEQLGLFRRLLDRTADMIYVVDATTGAVLDANEAVSRQLGYSRDELLRMRLTDFSITAGEQPWSNQVARARSHGSFVVEGWHRSKDGSALPVQISLSYAEQDHTSYLISVTRDITEQKRQQEVIERLARMLRMQSAISSAVLRIRDRDELLREACRLATHLGGYDRAVVSLLEPDGRTARPRFRAGSGTEFPEPDVLEIADGTEPDTSLTSRALRTGEIVVCNDIGNPESPVAMRERLLELGFKTVLALPLLVDGRKVGALTLTSRDPTFVTDDELLLLQDMAASLSFALRSQEHADAVRYVESYDSLTGLAKRPLFCQRFDAILSRIAPGRNPAIAAFDVHLLSSINDTFGRRFGDLLLQSVAERLRRNAESEAHVGYLGGGTFVLVEPELFTSAENISWVLDETVFGEPFSIEGREIRLSCRSGVARFPMDGRDSDTLLQNAEAALKRAKDVGEPYLHYKLEMHSEIAERLALEHRLRRAVDAGEFEVRYQPQLNIATGRIDAVEALLRWNDPEHGLVSPAQFLPVLESSGLIVPAGNWILARAVADCRAWQAQGLGPVRVSVNVSPLQLRRRMFVAHVLECLRGWPTRGGGYDLDLEITETALFHDMESSSRKLQELRAAGIRVALDDFGTGYSSLGLLSTLPVDILKIDRAFVRGLPDDRASVTLARSIVALASAFGLESVAEGVETPEQLQLLREMHCSYSQGYLHYPALRTGELEQVLASQAKLGNTGTAVG